MAPLRYAAKFDPFLSLDCTPALHPCAIQGREGIKCAIWQPCSKGLARKRNALPSTATAAAEKKDRQKTTMAAARGKRTSKEEGRQASVAGIVFEMEIGFQSNCTSSFFDEGCAVWTSLYVYLLKKGNFSLYGILGHNGGHLLAHISSGVHILCLPFKSGGCIVASKSNMLLRLYRERR